MFSKFVFSSTPGNAPVPQDVSNPSQYQSGHSTQPLNGVSYSQSAPTGPPSSMSAYHTASGAPSSNPSQRHPEERVATPQLPVVSVGLILLHCFNFSHFIYILSIAWHEFSRKRAC